MPVAESDMQFVKSANVPTNDSSTSGGAATSTVITGGVLGELIPSFTANVAGGANKTWYYKFFIKNNHGSDSITTLSIWVSNLLSDMGSNGTFSLVSDSAADNSSYKAKIYGLDAGGSNVNEEITFNGLTPVTGSTTFSELHCIEILNSSDVLTSLNGNVTVTRGTALGIIPAGCDYGVCETMLQIEEEAAKGGSDSSANRLTDPGYTWYTAKDSGSARSLDNLLAGESQGIWMKAIMPAGLSRQTRIRAYFRYSGDV